MELPCLFTAVGAATGPVPFARMERFATDDFSVTGSSFENASNVVYVVDGVRPKTAPAAGFVRKGQGGGGGAGGGVRGLGGRHAPKVTNDVMPRRQNSIGAEASRYVASRPPRSTAPKAGAFNEQKPGRTLFRTMYDRGDLPLRVNGGVQKFVRWAVKVPPSTVSNKGPTSFTSAGGPEYEDAKARFLAVLDYSVMLPLFFDGLREQTEPCRFLAAEGLKELLAAGDAARVGPIIPRLVLPLRQALNTREPQTIQRAILAIQQLVSVRGVDPSSGQTVGALLTPHHRHILPIFNLFKSRGSLNSSHDDYSRSIGETMDDTMLMMALAGGEEAAREIHRLVPLWVPPPPPSRRKGETGTAIIVGSTR